MSLMISVSGIRGVVGESLTPKNLTAFTTAFARWVQAERGRRNEAGRPRIVVGRDSRPTGPALSGLVESVLMLSGCDVLDIGLATTPTVELAVTEERADGGLIITASHNPVQWNALKMLDSRGEFLDAAAVEELLRLAEEDAEGSARWDGVGTLGESRRHDALHIEKILALPCIDIDAIRSEGLKVLVDCVEGAGAEIVPELCRRLGVNEIVPVGCGGTGLFPRNPEPIEENLQDTIRALKESKADLALVVDPDVDRLAVISEDGTLFGEEYTLVACADFYLKQNPGPVANNLSSSRALRDIADRYGVACHSGKVGEANVTEVMKEKGAVIGGEGNGGVILPELHYGRDALVAIALFLQAFAAWRKSNPGGALSGFRRQFPDYEMSKQKVELGAGGRERLPALFDAVRTMFPEAEADTRDGLKLDFPKSWVHLRPSNTEPIVRIYSEAPTKEEARRLADRVKNRLESNDGA